MVQLKDLSPLAQQSWAVSCATENQWLCEHHCNAKQYWLSSMRTQDARYLTMDRLRFDDLDDQPMHLCHLAITDRRGQNGMIPIPSNQRPVLQCSHE